MGWAILTFARDKGAQSSLRHCDKRKYGLKSVSWAEVAKHRFNACEMFCNGFSAVQ